VRASHSITCFAILVDDLAQVLVYASWVFASLLITLRVQVITETLGIWLFSPCPFFFRIAIWNRNIFMSSLLIGTWLADVGLYIYRKLRIPQFGHEYSIPDQRSFGRGAHI
jgi:hypothetical protein